MKMTLKILPLILALGAACPTLAQTDGTWSATGSMATQKERHTATLLTNGKVLVMGGYYVKHGANYYLDYGEIYDPSTGKWSYTAQTELSFCSHTATLLASGKVLLTGGLGRITAYLCFLYDPSLDKWTDAASMSQRRICHTATLLNNGKVLVAGGINSGVNVFPCELYDPATGKWSDTGKMSNERYDHTATLLADGKVLVTGGYSGSSVISSCDLYDPSTGAWRPTGAMAKARQRHTAILLPNGMVLVAGGCDGSSTHSTCELYNPSTGTWSSTSSMAAARDQHTATLLANGRVLVAGGGDGGLASCELYDPSTGAWSPTGSMAESRCYHTATLLSGNTVLVAGGYGGTLYRSSCELYKGGGGGDTWSVSFNAGANGSISGSASQSVANGGSTTPVTAVPATGYHFVNWTGDYTGADNPLTVVNVTKNMTITANFAEGVLKCNLTMAVSPDGSGTTSPAIGTSSVEGGVAIPVKATVSTQGLMFLNWTVSPSANAKIADEGAVSTTVTLFGDAAVTANFVPEGDVVWLTMTASPVEGGSTEPTGKVFMVKNTPRGIKAIPAKGYKFRYWTAESKVTVTFANSMSAETTVTLSDAATVTANFDLVGKKVQLAMAVFPLGSGTTNPAVGVSTEVITAVEYGIFATPIGDRAFVEWSAIPAGSAVFGDMSSPSTSIILSDAATVTANFGVGVVFMVSPEGTGLTIPAVNQTCHMVPGKSYSIQAAPNENYRFLAWGSMPLNGASFTSPSSVATTMTPNTDTVILASFAVNQHTVVFEAGTGGTIKGAATQTVDHGGACSAVEAVPGGGYGFTGWSGDWTGQENPLTLSNVLKDMRITAIFAKMPQVRLVMTVKPETGGTTDPGVGEHSVDQNNPLTIKATPATGSYFAGWEATGGVVVGNSSSSETTATLSGDATITAKFTHAPPSSATLIMAVSPENAGSTTPAVGALTVFKNVAQRIGASANSGYFFSGWTFDGDAVFDDASAESTIVTLTGDATVTAGFSTSPPIKHTLTMAVSPEEAGAVSPGGSVQVAKGIARRITATAADGYGFAGWSATPADNAVFDNARSSSTNVTLAGDATVTASFSVSGAIDKINMSQQYTTKLVNGEVVANWKHTLSLKMTGDFSAFDDNTIIGVAVGGFDSTDHFSAIADLVKAKGAKGGGKASYTFPGKSGRVVFFWSATSMKVDILLNCDKLKGSDEDLTIPVEIELAAGDVSDKTPCRVVFGDATFFASINWSGKVRLKTKKEVELYDYSVRGRK